MRRPLRPYERATTHKDRLTGIDRFSSFPCSTVHTQLHTRVYTFYTRAIMRTSPSPCALQLRGKRFLSQRLIEWNDRQFSPSALSLLLLSRVFGNGRANARARARASPSGRKREPRVAQSFVETEIARVWPESIGNPRSGLWNRHEIIKCAQYWTTPRNSYPSKVTYFHELNRRSCRPLDPRASSRDPENVQCHRDVFLIFKAWSHQRSTSVLSETQNDIFLCPSLFILKK